MFIFGAYGLGCGLERLYAWAMTRRGRALDRRVLLHRTFSVTTFLTINSFYFFAGRPNIRLMPALVQSTLDAVIVTLSTLWLVRVLSRSPARYQRESVVNTLLKQLKKFKTDFSRFLDGRSLDDLGPDEVYLLAKTAPGISQEQKHGVYKDVLREWIATGRTNSSQSLTMLAELRLQVGVTEDQHHAMLQELGIEDPSLLDPDARKEQENELRLESYGTALRALIGRAVERGADPDRLASIPEFSAELRALQSAYQIGAEEHQRAQRRIDQDGAGWRGHTLQLLREVGRLSAALYSLKHFTPIAADPLCRVLSRGISEERHRHAATLLRVAASTEEDSVLLHFAGAAVRVDGQRSERLVTRQALEERGRRQRGCREPNLGRVDGVAAERAAGPGRIAGKFHLPRCGVDGSRAGRRLRGLRPRSASGGQWGRHHGVGQDRSAAGVVRAPQHLSAARRDSMVRPGGCRRSGIGSAERRGLDRAGGRI